MGSNYWKKYSNRRRAPSYNGYHGYNMESLNDVIYARTGYHYIDQMNEDADNE